MKELTRRQVVNKYKKLKGKIKCSIVDEMLRLKYSNSTRDKFDCMYLAMGYRELSELLYIKRDANHKTKTFRVRYVLDDES